MRTGFTAMLAVSAALALAGTACPASASSARTGSVGVTPPSGGLRVSAQAGSLVPSLAVRGHGSRAAQAMMLTAVLAGQRRNAALRARLPGGLTGTVRAFSGAALAGACVTAYGAGGTGTARTASGGRFSISGLRAGAYTVKFSDCARPARYLPEWSGGVALPAMARQVPVRAGRVTTIPTVRLRPAGDAALFARTPGSQASDQRLGGISGRLTAPNGKPATRTCVTFTRGGGSLGVPVSAKGAYNTGRELPAGRYTVEFADPMCQSNPDNWAPQWYRGKTRPAAATRVIVRAGRTTRNINARMRHGATIGGTVTSPAGTRLNHVCVGVIGPGGDEVAQRTTRHGGYLVRGLLGGDYRVLFDPSCEGGSRLLPQWWHDKQSFAKATPIRLRLGHSAAGIDARLQVGGAISGTVRFKNSSGRPLRGICVDAILGDIDTGADFSGSTDASGRYLIPGLPSGSYTVFFTLGCNNNGNYLSASYPHPVVVRAGQAARGIDIALQPGGVMRGTVTGPRHQPIAHVGVIASNNDNEGDACTGAKGTYTITQLPPGRYTVQFINGLCGGGGSWAPQWYPGQTDPSAAVPVRVGRGQTVTGINATMRPGSTIRGTVTTGPTGKPVSRFCVLAQAPADAAVNIEIGTPVDGIEAQTGKTGGYAIRNLAAGRYAVEFGSCGGNPSYADRWFAGRPGAATGDILDLGAGATAAGVSAVVVRGGAISSAIFSSTGRPVSSSCEVLTNRKTGELTSTIFDPGFTGVQVGGLAPGRYTVEFFPCQGAGYAAQWYDRKSTPQAATPVRVIPGRVTGKINAALVRGGKITGRLTAGETGRPLANFCVEAVSLSGGFSGFVNTGTTQRDGDFTVPALDTGTYRLTFFNCAGSTDTHAGVTMARTVHVTAPRTTSGVNATAPAGGSISGTVRAGTPATGQGNVCVEADPENPSQLGGFAVTSQRGHYVLPDLAAGRYRIFFATAGDCDDSLGGLVPQWYDGAATRSGATTVTVTAGQNLSGIGATLKSDGGITGSVTARASGKALGGVCVRAVPQTARRAASFTTTAGGSYTLTGLTPGTYTVEFSSGCGATGYATQWWDDKSSAGSATVITVKAGAVTTRIDAGLDG